MNSDRHLEPAKSNRLFASAIAALAIAAVLGLTIALSGCGSLKAYIDCPPTRLQPNGTGGFTEIPGGCR